MRTTEKYKIAYKHVAGDLRPWSILILVDSKVSSRNYLSQRDSRYDIQSKFGLEVYFLNLFDTFIIYGPGKIQSKLIKINKALALVGENLSNGDVQKHWNAIQKDGIDYADFCNFISTLPE